MIIKAKRGDTLKKCKNCGALMDGFLSKLFGHKESDKKGVCKKCSNSMPNITVKSITKKPVKKKAMKKKSMKKPMKKKSKKKKRR